MAFMDKQFFIDMTAVLVLPECIRRDPVRHVSEFAKDAYNLAEALWNERERRFQPGGDAPNEPEPTAPPRVGPEF